MLEDEKSQEFAGQRLEIWEIVIRVLRKENPSQQL
jgi:hypothetical protein